MKRSLPLLMKRFSTMFGTNLKDVSKEFKAADRKIVHRSLITNLVKHGNSESLDQEIFHTFPKLSGMVFKYNHFLLKQGLPREYHVIPSELVQLQDCNNAAKKNNMKNTFDKMFLVCERLEDIQSQETAMSFTLFFYLLVKQAESQFNKDLKLDLDQ